MKRSTDRILTTHAGSLIRPTDLREMMQAQQSGGAFDRQAYETRLAGAVREVVRWQKDAGIDVVDDGEYGKNGFNYYILDRLTGLEVRAPSGPPAPVKRRDWMMFPEFYAELSPRGPMGAAQIVCTGPVSYKREAVDRDIANFKAALAETPAVDAFLPVIVPGLSRNEHYATEDDFLHAIADALNVEYRAIADAGIVVQIDDPGLPAQWDSYFDGDINDYRKVAEKRVELVNYALRGVPEEMVRYHICWGSWHGPHATDLPLRDIADIMVRVNAQGYSVEAANPQHAHEYHVWEDVKLPEGRLLIPGVIAHTTNIVEHPELVAERIENYAKLVGRENVIAGTDCGFAQGAQSVRRHPTIVEAKFRAMAEGAALATKRLWR